MVQFFKMTVVVLLGILLTVTVMGTMAQAEAPISHLATDKAVSCEAQPAGQPATSNSVVHVTMIHLNDVYEVTPVGGGFYGGISRIATIKKQLLAKNPNTYVFFAGDLYYPSGLSSAVVSGTQLWGEQAVAVMNKLGTDAMTFGDHEMDLPQEEFQQRLAETQFPIVSANILDKQGALFPKVTPNIVLTATNSHSKSISIGVFGVMKAFRCSYCSRIDHVTAMTEQVRVLSQTNFVVALTHFPLEVDQALSKQFSGGIDLMLGGDDHDYSRSDLTAVPPVIKSDSNARNVYIIDMYYDTAKETFTMTQCLQPVNSTIAQDPMVKAEADKWVKLAYDAFRAQGIDPEKIIARPTVNLDGLASSIRYHPTTFTTHVMDSFIQATAPLSPNHISLLFAGYVRLDDVIPVGGDFTQYDIIRAFASDYLTLSTVSGATLVSKILPATPDAYQGNGLYMLASRNITATVSGTTTTWYVDSRPVNPNTNYLVTMPSTMIDPSLAMSQTILISKSLDMGEATAKELQKQYPVVSKLYLPLIVKQ